MNSTSRTAVMPQVNTSGYNLKAVRVETLADRFVFFNLDPQASSLSQQAAGLAEELRTKCSSGLR